VFFLKDVLVHSLTQVYTYICMARDNVNESVSYTNVQHVCLYFCFLVLIHFIVVCVLEGHIIKLEVKYFKYIH